MLKKIKIKHRNIAKTNGNDKNTIKEINTPKYMDKTQIGQPVIQKHKDKQRPSNYHAGLKAMELKCILTKKEASSVGGIFT